MRTALLFSWTLCAAIVFDRAALLSAQTATAPPAQAKPAPPAQASPASKTPPAPAGQPAPQKPAAPAGRGAQPPVGRGGIAITVTTKQGFTLDGILVEMDGPTPRSDRTTDGGKVNFTQLQAGSYRLRFSGEQVTTFEREVTVTASKPLSIDITLDPAPPPREVVKIVEAPQAPPVVVTPGPAGQPAVIDIPDLLGKDFVGKDPRRETLIACSGSLRTMMLQINDPMPERLYEKAEVVYYVIGGEGTARFSGRDTQLKTNGLVSIPRGTPHSLSRRGNRPLVVLAFISGEPCEVAK
jgi:Carboxypeptidase regulatory-like domain/Cupin domain